MDSTLVRILKMIDAHVDMARMEYEQADPDDRQRERAALTAAESIQSSAHAMADGF